MPVEILARTPFARISRNFAETSLNNWRCVITVPGGGIQPRSGGEFDFNAPTDGYQEREEIQMLSTNIQWSDQATREYFAKLANGDYARFSFTMHAGGDHFFSIASYLNTTSGHNNLEYNADRAVSK